MTSSAGAAGQLTACERFYGLLARPFSLTPDLRFVFSSRSHSRALEQVTEALRRREGLIVVTGEIGTGKTVLCRTLLETFEARTFLSVILDPRLTVDELIHQVLADFGLIAASRPGAAPAPDVTRHQLVTALQRFLASLIPLNAHAVIMIDEAQHLTPALLEEIRLLSNFESDDAKLLQIVLVGQPNLEEVLKRPDMRQLDQRIARRCELQPLSAGEVKDYIERRLVVAAEPIDGRVGETPLDDRESLGSPGGLRFTPAAIRAVADISQGIPRVINILCDRALEVGFEEQTRSIDRQHVLAAAERLKLAVPSAAPIWRRAGFRTAAALVLAIAALSGWWWTSRASDAAAPAGRAAVLTPRTVLPVSTVLDLGRQPPPAPVQTGRYEISVAAFRTAQRAAGVASDLTASGLPASARFDAPSGWHRVVVGPFGSAEEAAAAQRLLEDQGFDGTHVYVRASAPAAER